MASKSQTLKKLNLAKSNPDLNITFSNDELISVVLTVVGAVNQIEEAVKKGRLDGKTPVAGKEYLTPKQTQDIIDRQLTEYKNSLTNSTASEFQSLKNSIEQRLSELSDGKDGEVTDEEVQKAAERAFEMLELPDFDEMLSNLVTASPETYRDGLELLPEGSKLAQDAIEGLTADIDGLKQAIARVGQLTGGSGTIGKQQVYNFIRQAVADGTISSGVSEFTALDDTPSSYTGEALKVIQVNAGETGLEFVPLAGGGDALTANPLSQFAATTSAQLAGVVSDETGTGALVFANSPTLVTPALGTPSALVLTNATGLPLTTGVTGDLPFSNIEQIATNRILGRSTAGTGDVESLADGAVRDIIGLATTDSPQFAGVNVGHATDTTITRVSAGVIAVEGTNVQLEPTEGGFADGDKTKLDGIEAGADVTDTTNVTAAGALMDSELTSITDVKALNQSVVSGASPNFTTTNMTDATNKRFMSDAQEALVDNSIQPSDYQTGSGAPATTPDFEGQIYTDTTADLTYIATGTASSADWKVQAAGTAGTPGKGSLLLGDGTDSFDELSAGTNDQIFVYDSAEALGGKKVDLDSGINFIIDGGGSAITTGIKGDVEIPFDCTIESVTLLADQSGSIVVDIWKDTYANFPATDADTITASAVPTISSATKSQDSTLTGWTTTLTKGDILRFNVDSVTTCERVTLSLKVRRNF